MSPSEGPTVRLQFREVDPFTEIRILDGNLERVPLEANTGPIDVKVPPGLYEVGFRRDGPWETQRVLVTPGRRRMTVKPADRPELFNTSEVANTVSDETLDSASVLVELKSAEGSVLDPAVAAQIGIEIVDCGDRVVTPLYRKAVAPGTWRFRARPGAWRMRLTQPGPTPPLELPLALSPGWGLQLVAPVRTVTPGDGAPTYCEVAFDALRVRMPPLHNAAAATDPILLSYEEAALSALASVRWLYGDHFETLINGLFADKPLNPMLGIYAAHLCNDPLQALPMIERLEALLGPGPAGSPTEAGHPDVRALRLKYSLAAGHSIDEEPPFPFPPLLARGWTALVEAARVRPGLIPSGSLCERIAERLWPANLWLVWYGGMTSALPREPEKPATRSARGARTRGAGTTPPPATAETGAFEESRATIVAALARAELREWFRAARERLEAKLDDASQGVEWKDDELSPLEVSIGTAIGTVAPSEENQEKYQRIALSYVHAAGTDAVTLASELGLPPVAVTDAAASLAAKVLRRATQLKLEREVRTPMARPELIIPYDPAFLGDGFVVPLPTLTPAARASAFSDGAVIDYTHYSLVMHRDRKTAMFTANNIDAARKVQVPGGLTWQMDERVGEYQLGRETYDDNQIDKGHLVRREDVLWGSVAEARAANKSTYFYTNASPQHQNFNQDEWKSLEDWVLIRATDLSYRLCVFTGPVFADTDPTLEDLPPHLRRVVRAGGKAKFPAAFWKVIVVRDADAGGDDLAAIAFAMKQSEMWEDKHGKRLLNLKIHQVTIDAIEQWTGLDFGSLKQVDELALPMTRTRAAAAAPWPEVREADDIVWSGAERRTRGLRAVRDAGTTTGGTGPTRMAPAAGGCCDHEFDAETAVIALSRDVARLTDLMIAQSAGAPPPAAPPPRSIADTPATRSLVEAAPTPADDGRGEAAASAAPDEIREQVRDFARALAEQGDVARGLKPPAEPKQLLRIVGGDVVPPGAFPHCVCIGDPTDWFCTGALVASQVVLTAAHCGGAISRIAVGSQVKPWLSADLRVVPVRRAVVHPQYRHPPFNEMDISILILDAPALVPPTPIATAQQIGAAQGVDIVGFGYNDPNKPVGFGVKRRVTIAIPPLVKTSPTADFASLEAHYGFHSDYEFVAGRKALGKDSCNGDSGGPVYITAGEGFRLAGLTSRPTREAVDNCGDGGINVRPDHFRPWIDATVAAAGLPPIAWS